LLIRVFASGGLGTVSSRVQERERRRMNDAVRERLVTILAAGIAYLISQQVVDRLIDIPDEPGLKDDVIEAVLKGATTATSTILASLVVRRLLRG
jgi:hypothetical protein